jgi:hypothetical protein
MQGLGQLLSQGFHKIGRQAFFLPDTLAEQQPRRIWLSEMALRLLMFLEPRPARLGRAGHPP